MTNDNRLPMDSYVDLCTDDDEDECTLIHKNVDPWSDGNEVTLMIRCNGCEIHATTEHTYICMLR